jgi:hypothetical protein
MNVTMNAEKISAGLVMGGYVKPTDGFGEYLNTSDGVGERFDSPVGLYKRQATGVAANSVWAQD